MINNRHIRVGALTMVLLLSMVMLVTIDASQNYVSAQYETSILQSTPLIPALEPSNSGKESLSSDDESNNSNPENTHFRIDPLTSEEEDELKDELLSSNDVSNNENNDVSDSQQDTSSTEEDEDALTNPLREQIRDRINGTLSTFDSTVP